MPFFHDATHASASAVLFSLNWSKILFDLVVDICLGSHSTWCNFKTWMVILALFTKIHHFFVKWLKKTVSSFCLDPIEIYLSQNKQWTKWSTINVSKFSKGEKWKVVPGLVLSIEEISCLLGRAHICHGRAHGFHGQTHGFHGWARGFHGRMHGFLCRKFGNEKIWLNIVSISNISYIQFSWDGGAVFMVGDAVSMGGRAVSVGGGTVFDLKVPQDHIWAYWDHNTMY